MKKLNSLLILFLILNNIYAKKSIIYDLIEIDSIPVLDNNLKNDILGKYYNWKNQYVAEVTLEGVFPFVFTIDTVGKIYNITNIKKFPEKNFNILCEVIQNMKFTKPAYKAGKPVDVRVYIELEFGKFD